MDNEIVQIDKNLNQIEIFLQKLKKNLEGSQQDINSYINLKELQNKVEDILIDGRGLKISILEIKKTTIFKSSPDYLEKMITIREYYQRIFFEFEKINENFYSILTDISCNLNDQIIQNKLINLNINQIDKSPNTLIKTGLFLNDILSQILNKLNQHGEILHRLENGQAKISDKLDIILNKIEINCSKFIEIDQDLQILMEQKTQLNEKLDKLGRNGNLNEVEPINLELKKINYVLENIKNQQDNTLEIITDNFLKILEKQNNAENVLNSMFLYIEQHLETDWERIQKTWKQYKEGEIGKKQLLLKAFKGLGKKVISQLPGLAQKFM